MKYYVSYPLFVDCNLQCEYCWFKRSHFATGERGRVGITPEQWCTWRDQHLKDAEEILVEFTGGETFLPGNLAVMTEFLEKTCVERLDMLTNGTLPAAVYETFLERYGSRVTRLGMSNHATIMTDAQRTVFEMNAHAIQARIGDRLYIKEIMLPGAMQEVLRSRARWNAEGFRVLVQDFKPPRDKHHTLQPNDLYGLEHVDLEYLRPVGMPCSCRTGYKTIIINSRWTPGDILACWHDQVVVGNIVDGTYNPAAIATKLLTGTTVYGVPKYYNPLWEQHEGNKRGR